MHICGISNNLGCLLVIKFDIHKLWTAMSPLTCMINNLTDGI